jgi:hypothetical protein
MSIGGEGEQRENILSRTDSLKNLAAENYFFPKLLENRVLPMKKNIF